MRYYVYTLIDPRNDEVFYVGKGQGKRIDEHEREARRGHPSKKCERIREISGVGLRLKRQKIEFFENEAEAYKREAELIARLPNLLNVMRGGSGHFSAPKLYDATAERKAALMILTLAFLCKCRKPIWDLGDIVNDKLKEHAQGWINKYWWQVPTEALRRELKRWNVFLIPNPEIDQPLVIVKTG